MLHHSTYDYLKPTKTQVRTMKSLRQAAKEYSDAVEANLPKGPDRTYILRRLRELVMWTNVAVTRKSDGAPRANGGDVD